MKFILNRREIIRNAAYDLSVNHIQAGETRFLLNEQPGIIDVVHQAKSVTLTEATTGGAAPAFGASNDPDLNFGILPTLVYGGYTCETLMHDMSALTDVKTGAGDWQFTVAFVGAPPSNLFTYVRVQTTPGVYTNLFSSAAFTYTASGSRFWHWALGNSVQQPYTSWDGTGTQLVEFNP